MSLKKNTYKPKKNNNKKGKILNHLTFQANKYIVYMIFFTFLGIIYIYINYEAEKMNQRISNLEEKIETLRANYTTLRCEYADKTTRSAIEKKMKSLNLDLIENNKLITKIITNK